MKKLRNLIIGVVLVVLVAIIAFIFVQGDNSSSKNNQDQIATSEDSSDVVSEEVTVTFSESGFSPSSVTLAAGGSLTIVNNSSKTIDFASDPHPAHTANSGLNVGLISPGESKTANVTEIGTWGFHNHLSPDESGTITVK